MSIALCSCNGLSLLNCWQGYTLEKLESSIALGPPEKRAGTTRPSRMSDEAAYPVLPPLTLSYPQALLQILLQALQQRVAHKLLVQIQLSKKFCQNRYFPLVLR